MKQRNRIAIAADRNGLELKNKVYAALVQDGFDVEDLSKEMAYYDVAECVCKAVQEERFDRGILVSATGQDMNIIANKFTGIRSAICFNPYTARLSRVDTKTNILCLSAFECKAKDAVQISKVFLTTDYYGNNKAGLEDFERFDREMKERRLYHGKTTELSGN